MLNKTDKVYHDLLKDILENGIQKGDRTGTGTRSVFGRQIRFNMKDGFPLLTTKKMYLKGIIVELLWFLRGDTNIKYLVDNGCNIWNSDAWKHYLKEQKDLGANEENASMEWFKEKIKNDDYFAKTWGELGPVYGKQWRDWEYYCGGGDCNIDQISNLIEQLKTNPNSRRLMVNAWNVGEIEQMTLPPCHYGFQVYTRELSLEERFNMYKPEGRFSFFQEQYPGTHKRNNPDELLDAFNIPKREISLMWNQRSVDTFLGLPFNIASYGMLLEMIAQQTNMVAGELIGNLGDVHLYNNHISFVEAQLTRTSKTDVLPKLNLNKANSIFDYKFEDFEIVNYDAHHNWKNVPISV